MNNEERMVADLAALKNFDAAEGRINVINNKMQQITELARAYANATPEQRERVDNATLQKVIDQYNELKNERTVLYAEQEARAQQELLAQKQAAELAAQQARVNTRRDTPRQRVIPETTNNTEPTVNERIVNAFLERGYTIGADGYFHNPDGSLYVSGNGAYVTGDGRMVPVNTTPADSDTGVDNNFEIIPLQEGSYIPFPTGTFGTGAGADYTGAISMGVGTHGGPAGGSVLSGNNITPVDFNTGYVNTGYNNTGNVTPININPTNEQFRISQVIGGHTYEYGDNGSVKIDGVLQRAGNGTDYIITQPQTNTGVTLGGVPASQWNRGNDYYTGVITNRKLPRTFTIGGQSLNNNFNGNSIIPSSINTGGNNYFTGAITGRRFYK